MSGTAHPRRRGRSARPRAVLLGTAVPVLAGAVLLLPGCSPSGGSALPDVESGAKRAEVEFSTDSSEPTKGEPDFPEVEAGSKAELAAKIRNETDRPQKVKDTKMRMASSAAGKSGKALRREEITKPYDGCAGKTLEAGKSCQVLFRYAPKTAGSSTTELVVDFDGPTPDIRTEVTAVARPKGGGTTTRSPGGTAPVPTGTVPTGTLSPTGGPTGPTGEDTGPTGTDTPGPTAPADTAPVPPPQPPPEPPVTDPAS